jgi:subtilisin family serine protease
MRRLHSALLAGAFATLAACSDAGPAAVAPPEPAPLLSASGRAVPGSYIVVLKEGADPRSAAAVAGVSPRHVYSSAVNGFAAELDAGQLDALRRNPAVEYVEQDQVAEAAFWNLDRIRIRGRNDPIPPPTWNTAAGVYAYIIDTGIYTVHPEFGGRAQNAYDALGGNGQDCNGHGTLVAGIVNSVARNVRLRSVRVLDCSGSGSMSDIIAGVDWVRMNRTNPAVANLSLGGGYSSTLNAAVNNLAGSGVFISVAAGNNNANACNYSPASATSALTVAASTMTDARASFSNYGSCVDIYAPGVSITSTSAGGGTTTVSGTSFAAPHATGVAALYKSVYGNASSATIDAWIKANATLNVISGNPAGTPNRLLYQGGL